MMRRLVRDRRLTADEAAKYREVRENIAQELPSLIQRHHERVMALESLEALFPKLKAAREERGLSLAEIKELTGCDEADVQELESGQAGNPTVRLLIRYAEAVGKRLHFDLVDA